jgi:hypothetical protein
MVELQVVVLAVAGSSPVDHPTLLDKPTSMAEMMSFLQKDFFIRP